MSEYLIKVDNLGKKFCRSLKQSLWYGFKDLSSEIIGNTNYHKDLRKDEFWALKKISFDFKRGESLGIIGKNGAGKTTLLRVINGLIKPDHGIVEIRGSVQALISLGVGFNPVLTGRENIYVSASIMGISKQEINKKLEEIIDFSGVEQFIDSPVKNYSSGMLVRLGFAVAINVEPDILLVDEVLAVGDANFQRKSYLRMRELLNNGTGIILISHNAPAILSFCKNGLLLDKGEMKEYGEIFKVMQTYNNILDKSEHEDRKNKSSSKNDNNFIVDDIKFYDLENKLYLNNEVTFRNGIVVEVSYHNNLHIKNPFLYGTVLKDGQILSLIGGNFSSKNPKLPDDLPNKGKIKFIIKSQNLTPGTYEFSLGLRHNDALFYENILEKIAVFRIKDDYKIKGFLYNKNFPMYIDSEVVVERL